MESTRHSRFRHHMRHAAPLSRVVSVDCAYFPSPRGCTQSSSTFHESPFSCLCRKNERSYRLAQHRIYWKFVTAICATFFARSNVALRLPPINRTLPVTSCASSDLPALSVNRQCTLICVAPVTVVTCRFPSLPCLKPYTLLCFPRTATLPRAAAGRSNSGSASLFFLLWLCLRLRFHFNRKARFRTLA